jgi:hypothetical protein
MNQWAVYMDDIMYGTKDIPARSGGKMAIIDSGNTTI